MESYSQEQEISNYTEQKNTATVFSIVTTENSQTSEVIDKLLELGLSPQPVAPKLENTKFTGKNPSFIDASGKHQFVGWRKYQKTRPTKVELSKWFADPSVGVGAIFTSHLCAIDFDRKQFKSDEEYREVFENWLNSHPGLKETWLEQTQGGGNRLIVEFVEPVDFRNMTLAPGGKHIGEIIANGFAVLAPTVGVSGNEYKLLANFGKVIKFRNADFLSIYPVAGQSKNTATVKNQQEINFNGNSFNAVNEGCTAISLEKLAANWLRDLLDGKVPQGMEDRSEIITKAIREYRGWANWLSKINGVIEESESYIIQKVGHTLGIESDRLLRIVRSFKNDANPQPGIAHYGEAGVWKKIYWANKELHEQHCPVEYKYVAPDKSYEQVIELTQADGSLINIKVFGSLNKFELWQKTKAYTNPDITICERYFKLSNHVENVSGRIIAKKSGMGTGKSTSDTELIVNRLAGGIVDVGAKSNKGCIVVTPRQQLNKNFAGSLTRKILEYGENKANIFPVVTIENHRIRIINSEVTKEEIAGFHPDDTIICCAESLHRIPDHIANKPVIFDEWNTIIDQAVGHKTSEKLNIFGMFKQIGLQADSIILGDANLNDITVNFAVECFGKTKELVKILNTYKNGFEFTHCLPVKNIEDLATLSTRDRSASLNDLLDAVEKGKVYFPSDAKALLESFEEYLRKEGKSSFLLSFDTKDETWQDWLNNPTLPHDIRTKFMDNIVAKHPSPNEFLGKKWSEEFLDSPDAFLENYIDYYDVFFQSPSGSTGISIDNKKGIIKSEICYELGGIISVEESTQQPCRLRNYSPVERFIYYSDKAHVPGEKHNSMDEYDELLNEYTETLINQGAPSLSEARTEAMVLANQAIEKYPWREFAKQHNYWKEYEKTNSGACYAWLLVQQGNIIKNKLVEVDPVVKEELKNIKRGQKNHEANLTHVAKILNEHEKEAYKDKSSKEAQARKKVTHKEELYPGITECPTWTPGIITKFHLGSKSSETDRMIRNYMMWQYPETAARRNEVYDYFSVTAFSPNEMTKIQEDRVKLDRLRSAGFLVGAEIVDGAVISWDASDFIANVKARKLPTRTILGAPKSHKGWADGKGIVKWINGLYKFVGLNVRFENEDEEQHWQFLIDSAIKQYQGFEKEGKFITDEAWKHALRNDGQRHPDFTEMPSSLKNRYEDNSDKQEIQKQIDDVVTEDLEDWDEEISSLMVDAYQSKDVNLLTGTLQCITEGYTKYKKLEMLARTKINDLKESLEFGAFLRKLWESDEVQKYITQSIEYLNNENADTVGVLAS